MRTDILGMMNGPLKIAGRGKSPMARSATSNISKILHKICHVNLNLSSPELPKPFNCGQVPGMLFKPSQKSQPENPPNMRGIPWQKGGRNIENWFPAPNREEKNREKVGDACAGNLWDTVRWVNWVFSNTTSGIVSDARNKNFHH
jgi:hypothetical protein